MAHRIPQKKRQIPPFLTGIGTFFLGLSVLLFGGALLPLATGLSLSIAWFSCGLASLLFFLITRTKGTHFLTANLLFISGMLIVMDEQARSSIGSPAWNQAVGGLVVAVWVAGLLYIILASLVRLFGKQKMDRFFSPRVVGPTLILAGLSAIPFLLETTVISPVRDFGSSAYKSWILLLVTIATTGIFLIFKKTRKISGLMPAAAGLVIGLVTALLLDGIELWWLSKDISQTLLLGPLHDISSSRPLFVFQDFETYFGFWSYVHFDAQALIAVVPLVLIAFGLHLTASSRDSVESGSATSIEMDRILVGEGICTMASGLLSGIPMVVNFKEERGKTKHSFWPFLLACLTLLVLSFLSWFTDLQTIFPAPIIGGTLIGVLMTMGFQGFRLTFPKGSKPTWIKLIFPGVILLFGTAGIVVSFIGSIYDLWGTILSPWGIPVAPLSIVVVLSFFVNAFLPTKAKVSSNDTAPR